MYYEKVPKEELPKDTAPPKEWLRTPDFVWLRPVPVSSDVEEAARGFVKSLKWETDLAEGVDMIKSFLAGHALASARLADLERENRELKEGMIDVQELGALFGIPLGQTPPHEIIPWIKEQIDEEIEKILELTSREGWEYWPTFPGTSLQPKGPVWVNGTVTGGQQLPTTAQLIKMLRDYLKNR